MQHFCFFCITYYKDFNLFCRMIESFKKHNVENIPFIIALQDENIYANKKNTINMKDVLEKFKSFEDNNIKIILDSDFAYEYLLKTPNPNNMLSSGYINQEVAKLSFFEYGFVEHYLCIDSDTFFIRDFFKKDFFYDEKTPYITLMQDKDLHSKSYYVEFAEKRLEFIKKIFNFIDFKDERFRTCHNSQILSTKVLNSFKNDFMKPKNINYLDLLEIAPFEFSWYNAYFQKSGLIREIQIEPFFKMYHTKAEYILDRFSGQNIKNLKFQYLGIILNSNWGG